MFSFRRFFLSLCAGIKEAYDEGRDKLCSRSCSEMHTFDKDCILRSCDE